MINLLKQQFILLTCSASLTAGIALADPSPVQSGDPSSDAPGLHLIKHFEGLSRDTEVISFAHTDKPYSREDIIGGEHTSEIMVLGFPGERYLIRLEDLEGETQWGISGNVIFHDPEQNDDNIIPRIGIVDQPTLFTISLNAHPDARYRLVVQKIQGKPSGD